MRRRLVCLGLLGVTIAATALYDAGRALATEAEGYKSTLLALGHFRAMEVTSTFPRGQKVAGDEQAWQSLQQTNGLSDVYVQSNVWAPGGSTGWHSHPGHSLIIVTGGTVTDYEGHDPDCKPHVYKTGMGFVDPGETMYTFCGMKEMSRQRPSLFSLFLRMQCVASTLPIQGTATFDGGWL